jgi:hypothetical protein
VLNRAYIALCAGLCSKTSSLSQPAWLPEHLDSTTAGDFGFRSGLAAVRKSFSETLDGFTRPL